MCETNVVVIDSREYTAACVLTKNKIEDSFLLTALLVLTAPYQVPHLASRRQHTRHTVFVCDHGTQAGGLAYAVTRGFVIGMTTTLLRGEGLQKMVKLQRGTRRQGGLSRYDQ